MNNKTAIVGAVGLGAALMYFFDPDRGRRRRALVRDKVEAAGNKVEVYAEKMGQDIRNRAYGVVAETKSILRGEEVSDSVLVDRVRAKLGRYPVHLSAIDIQANNGTVTLTGPIQAEDVPAVLRATRFVRGVKAVDNQLTVEAAASAEPSLPSEPQPLGAQAT